MTDALFSTLELADTDPTRTPGTRLRRLEVYNWGTFHNRVWTFDVDGHNALLTGDIGSGKSTLVDAVTTLLLPSQRISYNKAAGADTRERDLRSYVLGHYRSERNEITGASRPVALRDARAYAVLLGVFVNTDFDTTTTLAQVFWSRASDTGQPERFYVVADGELSIAEHFADFGGDLAELRRRLQRQEIKPYKAFPEYGRELRRRLGIESEQAMELFHQTVSMKAVDNLNDFVRHHMLEPFDVGAQIESLVHHFEDLTRAHEAVVRARAQLELLVPLVAELDTHDKLAAEVADLGRQRAALPYFLAGRRARLLEVELDAAQQRIADLTAEERADRELVGGLRVKEAELSVEIAGHGGDRIAGLEADLTRLTELRETRRRTFDRFNALLAEAGLRALTTVDQFAERHEQVGALRVELERERANAQNAGTEARVGQRETGTEAEGIAAELRSLQGRHNNLPTEAVAVRRRLVEDLSLPLERLPFAGELLQVRAEAQEWEGAAERVLYSFARSLLVPNDLYDVVAAWIDRHHLGTRLVYFRVPERVAPQPASSRRAGQLLLADCLEIKPDTAIADWLFAELDRRAAHVCVASVAEFRGVTRAVTRAGQIKDRERHEKDDRRAIDDRRSFALGWTNERKIDALLEAAHAVNRRLEQVRATIAAADRRLGELADRLSATQRLGEYGSPAELDWSRVVADLTATQAQLDALRQSSDLLTTLTAQRDQVRAETTAAEGRRSVLQQRLGSAGTVRDQLQAALAGVQELLRDAAVVATAEASFAAIEKRLREQLGELDATELERRQSAVVADWTDRIERRTQSQQQAAQRAIRRMGDFRVRYPAETAELDDTVAAGDDYRQLHDRVDQDDLPRFESEFKESLNKNTIRDIATFFAQLSKQETLIKERVARINDSLTAIDYNPGRYIVLVPDRTPSLEIRDFVADLTACTDNVVSEATEQYSEQKFLQVKKIIDRFRGREGYADVDRQWTRRVTDVRNWFVFSASERWRDDESEYENYTDSGGKSGGQKEKLAYTILAASLAYQFRLDWGTSRSKAFRFVVIDEAFGRGSDESTKFALRLFTRLGLQLLIVTPLQKIHVIAPHVSAVGFVDNQGGGYSRLQRMTITEYRRRRSERVDGDRSLERSGTDGSGRGRSGAGGWESGRA